MPVTNSVWWRRLAARKRGFVDPDRHHSGEAVRVVDERRAVLADRAHHRGPADAEPECHRGDVHPVLADQAARLPPSPFGKARPGPQRLAGLAPGHDLTRQLRAAPQPLKPQQQDRPSG